MLKRLLPLALVLSLLSGNALAANLLTAPYSYFADANGLPLNGCKVYTYSAGTTTPKSTYTDSGAGTPNANPTICDSAGRAVLWLVGNYKVVVKDSLDNTIRTVDNVSSATATGDMSKSTYDPANIAMQVVGTSATQTLTNKTLTTPTLNQPTINGVTNNSSAAAGVVGEIIESNVPVGSAISITSTTGKSITSISLTAGDWDVWGNVGLIPTGAMSKVTGSISQTDNTDAGAPNGGAFFQLQATLSGAAQVFPVGIQRISLASTTTIYLVTTSTFASTCTAYGYIGARRVR